MTWLRGRVRRLTYKGSHRAFGERLPDTYAPPPVPEYESRPRVAGGRVVAAGWHPTTGQIAAMVASEPDEAAQ